MCAQGYVTDVDKDTDTIVVQSDFVRIYSNPGIFVAFFQGCCRPNALVNNPNSPWRFETTVVCVYVVCVCVCVCVFVCVIRKKQGFSSHHTSVWIGTFGVKTGQICKFVLTPTKLFHTQRNLFQTLQTWHVQFTPGGMKHTIVNVGYETHYIWIFIPIRYDIQW